MHWYWWVLILIVGIPILLTFIFYIWLRYFTPPGDYALALIGKEKEKINWLDALLWPLAWFLYKLFEDC
jgi:hypothetical protein